MSPIFTNLGWPKTPWFRANILMSGDGRFAGPDGTSATLTRGRDRDLLRALRADADAVIVGGQSVRTEGWFFPPHGLLIVVTQSRIPPRGDCPHPERLLLVPEDSLANGDTPIGEQVVSLLARNNLRHAICEAGPTLLKTFLANGVVDEIFVSLVEPTNGDVETEISGVRATLGIHPEDFPVVAAVPDAEVTFLRFSRH